MAEPGKGRRSFLVDALSGVAGLWVTTSGFLAGCVPVAKYGGPPTSDAPPTPVLTDPEPVVAKYGGPPTPQGGPFASPPDPNGVAVPVRDAGAPPPEPSPIVAKYGGPPEPVPTPPPVVAKYGGPPRPPPPVAKYGGPPRL
jgi:hypothetical protein